MRIYLGCFNPKWLRRTSVPLFMQRGPLSGAGVKNLGRALGPWSLDSGGFTEIGNYGKWTVTPEEYAREVRFWQREIGNLEWAAPQDWMSEPPMLFRALLEEPETLGGKLARRLIPNHGKMKHDVLMAEIQDVLGGLGIETLIDRALKQAGLTRKKTLDKSRLKALAAKVRKMGRDIGDLQDELRRQVCVHQQRTIDNFLELQRIAPEIRWIPVLQGWKVQDYLAHAEAYERAGVDLNKAPVVGLGSVCRREKLDTAQAVVTNLTGGKWKLRLHGFGLKKTAFEDPILTSGLVSSDSAAWSFGARKAARRRPEDVVDEGDEDEKASGRTCSPGPGHEGGRSCSNCFKKAMEWRLETIEKMERTMFLRIDEVRGRRDGHRRRAANAPVVANPKLDPREVILNEIVLPNLESGHYIRSAGGKAEYMVLGSDPSLVTVRRLSTGREIEVPTRRIVDTAIRLLKGEKIPVRGISFTVTIEAVIVAGLKGMIDLEDGKYYAVSESAYFPSLLPRLRRAVRAMRANGAMRVAGDGGKWWKRRNPGPSVAPTILYAPASVTDQATSLYVDPAHAAQDDQQGDVLSVDVTGLDRSALVADLSGELQQALDGEPDVVADFGGRRDAADYDWIESLRIVGRATYEAPVQANPSDDRIPDHGWIY